MLKIASRARPAVGRTLPPDKGVSFRPRCLPAMMRSTGSVARGVDEAAEDAPVAVAQPVLRMPLHTEDEAPLRVLDAFDHAVGRDRIDDQAGCDVLDRLMMCAVDRHLGK